MKVVLNRLESGRVRIDFPDGRSEVVETEDKAMELFWEFAEEALQDPDCEAVMVSRL